MNRRIFEFNIDEKTVLGFDTGLGAQAFAQAKMAQFITSPGTIIYPDGRLETWQPGGAAEPADTIVIWGPSFPGESLAGIINDSGRKDEALAALACWVKARTIMEGTLTDGKESPYPGPAGALIVSNRSVLNYGDVSNAGAGEGEKKFPVGTVFFPPFRLLKRTLEAGGKDDVLNAERWVHPDLKGKDSITFSAGAMLYRIFCGAPPFSKDDEDILRQDIREAVCLPPELAAPGLDPEMAAIINRSLRRTPSKNSGAPMPPPEAIGGLIAPASPKPVSSWIKPLTDEEISKIRTEQERFTKKKTFEVKTRRFVIRNTAIIAGVLIALVVVVLIVRGAIQHNAELPTTKGMTPIEVAAAYYNAFGNLDHTLMQACVSGKAGKGDIDMVVNLYVISRVRQAYETAQDSFISAQDWVDEGSPSTDKTVFGVTNLIIKTLSENNGTANLEVEYVLWMPGSYLKNDAGDSQTEAAPNSNGGDNEDDSVPLPPGGLLTKDKLTLTLNKEEWHITAIDRTANPIEN